MIVLFGLLGIVLFAFSIYIFRVIPQKWVCDFGEKPEEKHNNRDITKNQLILVLTGGFLSFTLCYLQFGAAFKASILCICFCLVLICCICDAKFQIIPVELCIMIAILALFNVKSLSSFLSVISGGAILFWVFFCLGLLGKLIYKKEVLGFGDVYFAGAIGLYFSYFNSLKIFVITLFISAVYFLVLKIINKINLKNYMALGPFIGISFVISIVFERQIDSFINWYISLIR